jgi:hypothetical protein
MEATAPHYERLLRRRSRHSREGGNPNQKLTNCDHLRSFVALEYARRKSRRIWIPAFAGMTKDGGFSTKQKDQRIQKVIFNKANPTYAVIPASPFVIPAKAGIQIRRSREYFVLGQA